MLRRLESVLPWHDWGRTVLYKIQDSGSNFVTSRPPVKRISMQEFKDWEVLQSDYVLDNKFWRIRRDQVRLPDGSLYDYYRREHEGWAGILCLTEDNKIVLIRQYRHGLGEVVIELPAGAVDPGEDPGETAKRELEEETGYQTNDIELVQKYAV